MSKVWTIFFTDDADAEWDSIEILPNGWVSCGDTHPQKGNHVAFYPPNIVEAVILTSELANNER